MKKGWPFGQPFSDTPLTFPGKMDKLHCKMKKRCDEDEYPPWPAQRAAVLVKGGEEEEEKNHLGATELKSSKPRRLASLPALSGSG